MTQQVSEEEFLKYAPQDIECEPDFDLGAMQEDKAECCEGCALPYKSNDVMVVEGVGPVCLKCLYVCATFTFTGKAFTE